MNSVTLTKTIICPLETSRRKNDRVRTSVERYEEIVARLRELLPSMPAHQWAADSNTHLYRMMKRDFPDSNGLYAANAQQAIVQACAEFNSWDSNGRPGEKPSYRNGDFCRLRGDHVDVEENDRGFGIKTKLEPRTDPEWFHVRDRPYIRDHLADVTRGDASTGSAELHLHDDGSLDCHLSVSRDVDVPEVDDVDRVIGVDLGERTLFAAAVLDAESGEVVDGGVEVESGREFRHHRDRLTSKRAELMAKDDLRGVRACRDEHRRYTDQVTHVTSRRIVDLAVEHRPAAIVLEDLSGYRDSAGDPIHDWPFGELQEKVVYKAKEAGVPVVKADPTDTSVTCSGCGVVDRDARQGADFECAACGYEVHADVNAAKNIGRLAGS